MSSCSGTALSGLVDGALGHTERDRVHNHLAGCADCRAELEALRALKLRLSTLAVSTPDPSDELLARLRGLALPGVEPGAAPALLPRAVRPGPGRLREGRSASPASSRGPEAGRPAARPAGRRRARRTGAVGGGLLLLGVGLALVLGSPTASAPSTPVDPGSDAFVVDFVSTTSAVPLADPAGRAAMLPRP